MKLHRAEEHFNSLYARISQWNSSRVYRAPLRVSDDRHHLEFLQPVGVRPPLDEWGLVFGDAVHNMRSALDCTIWEFAHLDGVAPSNPRQVSFPVLTDRSKWDGAASRLSSVPSDLLSRVEAVQPFNDPDPTTVDKSWLSVISKLDNDDKHRGVVVGVPVIDQVAMEGLDLQLGEAILGGEASLEIFSHPNTLEDGAAFARLTFGSIIDPGFNPTFHAVVGIMPAAPYMEDLIPIAEIHRSGIAHLAQILEYLRTGEDSNEGTTLQSEHFEPR